MKCTFPLCCMALLLWCSCLKEAAVLPPAQYNDDPQLPVNYWVGQLRNLLHTGQAPLLIDSDWTVAAIVTADDQSGNFYKQIVLQDSTGGITVQINSAQLYRRFPIGRKIYIRLKGLYIGSDHGLPELGYLPAPDNSGIMQVSGIPAGQMDAYIVPATIAHTISPVSLQPADMLTMDPARINRLVQIRDVEVADPYADNVYAETQRNTNITLAGCDGSKFIVRSSGYAGFAGAATPRGHGNITGIYTVYDGTVQLVIRDTNDVAMQEARCNGHTLSQPATMSIAALRALYKGKDVVMTAATISGTVISDAVSGNSGSEGNIIVQQGNSGIIVYFGSSATDIPALGDSITLNVAGATLTSYNGALELKNIKTNKVTREATGRTVTPVTLTIAELNAHFTTYESVLVRIPAAKISGSGNYGGSKTLSDGTGEIILFTSSTASFAGDRAPTITRTFQGIPTPYNTTRELKLRNPAIDVY